MTLLDRLRKLGVLRWGGTKAVYRNSLERPLELQDTGVFDAKHDLIDDRSGFKSQRDRSDPANHRHDRAK